MGRYDMDPQDRGRKMATVKSAGLSQMASTAQMNTATRADRIVNAASLEARLVAREGIMQYADVTLTSAQVKALAATQIELVAAPGAGKMLQFMGALLKLDYGTNVFTESSITLGIKFTDDTGVQVSNTIEATGFIDQSADTYSNAIPVLNTIVAASAAENKALVLDNLGAGEIAGNAANDNTLVVRCFYQIVTI